MSNEAERRVAAPERVKIGPFDFEVRFVDLLTEDNCSAFGQCNLKLQAITVSKGHKCQKVADTFLHEVLHAISWVYGPVNENGSVKEEELVKSLSFGLVAFWRDNPEVCGWWADLLLTPDRQFAGSQK